MSNETLSIKKLPEKLKAHNHENDEHLPETLEQIILFGSHARGEARLSSDIDVALVFSSSPPRVLRAQVRSMLDLFSDCFEISVFTTTKALLNECTNIKNANYWIREEGRILWQSTHINI